MEKKIAYPMRINKYLATKGVASRREADKFIEEKKVTINGRLAVLGDKVNEGDLVETKNIDKNNVYLAFNKPKGIITNNPQGEEKEINEIIKYPQEVFALGRLDKESEGLIILTNDGRITDRLLNPENAHEKEYVVMTDKSINPEFLRIMKKGVRLDDGYITKKCSIAKLADRTFSIILTEGKKRQIRRMCESLGRRVMSLKRVRIMNIELGKLKSGELREMKGKELEGFLQELGY
jgi:23S rRNA pseudouridine2604 synthase